MVSPLLLLLTLLSLATTAAAPESTPLFDGSTAASLKANIVGECTQATSISPTSTADPAASLLPSTQTTSITITTYPASASERQAYAALTETLTMANPLLGTSQRAQRWAKQKAASWQLPLEHPRQNKTNCVNLAREAGTSAMLYYRQMRRESDDFYTVFVRDALIHEKGVILPGGPRGACGYIQTHEACETFYRFIGRTWSADCARALKAGGPAAATSATNYSHSRGGKSQSAVTAAPSPPLPPVQWADQFTQPAVFGPSCFAKSIYNTSTHKWAVHDKVFAITSGWDNNYHHFLVDSLARLARHYDWLQAHPDVKIHIRGFESMAKKERFIQGGRDMRARILALLSLDPARFITGPTLARHIWMARGTRCNYPLGHAFELRLLSDRMLKMARVTGGLGSTTVSSAIVSTSPTSAEPTTATAGSSPRLRGPRVTLQHRHCQNDLACKREKWREMNNDTYALYRQAIIDILRPSELHEFSSSNDTQRRPDYLPEEIQAYANTDILIGLHGAGLTNIMFMPPGSLLFEIVGDFDGRFAPVCGYHGPLAAAFGIHHYLYFYDYREKSEAYTVLYPLDRPHFTAIAEEAGRAWDRLQARRGEKK